MAERLYNAGGTSHVYRRSGEWPCGGYVGNVSQSD